MRVKDKEHGFSLIQLVIGALIASIVVLAAYKIYQVATQLFNQQIVRLDKTGQVQFVSAILKNAVDHAGFLGCAEPMPWVDRLFSGVGKPIWEAPVVYGMSAGMDTIKRFYLDKKGSGKIVPESDILIIQGSKSESIILNNNLKKGDDVIAVPSSWKVKPYDYLIFNNCLSFYVVQIKAVKRVGKKKLLNFLHPLKQEIKAGMELSIWQHHIYYIGNTGRMNKKGKQINALYMQDTQGRRHELVYDINSMSIKYVLYKPNTKNYNFITASAVKNWQEIRQLEILLLLPEQVGIVPINIAIKRNIP